MFVKFFVLLVAISSVLCTENDSKVPVVLIPGMFSLIIFPFPSPLLSLITLTIISIKINLWINDQFCFAEVHPSSKQKLTSPIRRFFLISSAPKSLFLFYIYIALKLFASHVKFFLYFFYKLYKIFTPFSSNKKD